MNLFKKKKYISHSDLIKLIELSDEFIESAKEHYSLDNENELSNKINKAILEARISQINSYKYCFEKLIEEYFKRETPLYWKLNEAYKQLKTLKGYEKNYPTKPNSRHQQKRKAIR